MNNNNSELIDKLTVWYGDAGIINTTIDNAKYSMFIQGESKHDDVTYKVFREKDRKHVLTVRIWDNSDDSEENKKAKSIEVEVRDVELSKSTIEQIINTISDGLGFTNVDAKSANISKVITKVNPDSGHTDRVN